MSPRRPIGSRRRKAADQEPETPVLMVIHGPDLGKVYTLDAPTVVIGSGEGVDVLLEVDGVCGVHAKLTCEDGRVTLNDCDSDTGTFVNDALIEEVVLSHGDRIRAGRAILRHFCTGVAQACEQERQRLTTHCGLTQLYNRRAFREHLELELKRCKRYGRDLSVFIYGVDELDRLERRIGEAAVDSLLVQVTSVVAEFLSRDDLHARYGEEEFAVVLPEVNQAQALLTAERLREAVEKTEFVWHDQVVEVTISIGVATFERTMEDLADFITEIDKNLYQSTKAGRNRVIGVEGGVTRCS